MILDVFALLVIALLLGVAIWLIVLLGNLPGEIARKYNHPQSQAITAMGWIGLVTGLGWFIAIVWAYYKPQNDRCDLQDQINELKSQLQQLQGRGDKS